ncbi:hypothetical protein BDY19DRAFT_12697 [Irpex rosettiformis]|uniref:Uncharacterized protein n=1 Tax=Irpex rosettiformis TaxID=378272 RepID=A0ACB8UJ51_9APHY|nr:hypothetical protein BDY19DRAFT_12697 [Irpex rosettiformis]
MAGLTSCFVVLNAGLFERQLETGYPINIITSTSTDGSVAFLSRMFAPAFGIPEDHVCGSAHCSLTPYWANKSAKDGAELLAKQVSVRGGDIRTIWHEAKGTITLSGQMKVIMKGEMFV